SKKSTYIKRALVFNNTLEKEELFYESIFNEIRDLQTAKKNSYIENEYIEKISEVQKFNRHIYKKDLHMLIINRYVGVDLFNESMIPPAYVKEISELDEDDIEDHLLDCKSNISRAFFDKNSKYEFWAILESIIIEVKKKPKSNIRAILDRIPVSRMDRLQHLDSSSILLLIALIKSGLKNDNK
ncbi:hypothetical protein L1D34_30645, partial [Vibrio mediterranei]|nr:hypothetical protein [Vibrio mediterranei]